MISEGQETSVREMGRNTSRRRYMTSRQHNNARTCVVPRAETAEDPSPMNWPNRPQVVAFSRLKIKLLPLFKMNSSEYLNQLLKDKTTISKMPKIFLHLERLLDEGEFIIYKFTIRKSTALNILRFFVPLL